MGGIVQTKSCSYKNFTPTQKIPEKKNHKITVSQKAGISSDLETRQAVGIPTSFFFFFKTPSPSLQKLLRQTPLTLLRHPSPASRRASRPSFAGSTTLRRESDRSEPVGDGPSSLLCVPPSQSRKPTHTGVDLRDPAGIHVAHAFWLTISSWLGR
jgi:hypothetical protein